MNLKLVLLSMILSLLSISSADEWLTEEILDHSGIGSDCDLVIDESRGLHICFHYMSNTLPGSNLYCAYKEDSSDGWEITPVDVDNYDFLGDDCEIDLDSDENPHISYLFERDFEYLPYVKYAAFNGTSWQMEQLTTYPQWAGPGTSLFMDADDNPHLFYPRYGELVYQWNDGTDTWISETLESGYMFFYPHTAGDPSGNIGVAYFYLYSQQSDLELHYAYNDGASWNAETAFNANPCRSTWQLDMVYDLDSHPHIVYVATQETDDMSLLLHTWHDGSVWSTDNLGATSTGSYTFPSIAVDDDNHIHISYSLRPTGSGDGVLHHISDESDTWADVIVKDGINSWNTAIDIAPDNQPHIIYYNYSGGITNHAWRTDGTGIEDSPGSPVAVLLGSPYPTPCSGFSSVGYTITENTTVRLELYDMSGRVVTTLTEGFHQAGDYQTDVSDLSPGVYIFRLTTVEAIETRKLVVL